MSTTLLSLALLCAAANPVETAKTPGTLLYVRTTPAGAEIRLDGKPLGTSDDIFRVEPGAYKIVLDLENYQPEEQQITIRDGRITRIELKLKREPKANARAAAAQPPAESVAAPQTPRILLYLVVGKDRMTFQGKDTTWDELAKLLEKVPASKNTVLHIARAPGEMTAEHWDQAVHRAIKLIKRFGFGNLSDIGVHPLGFKGGPSQAIPQGKADPAAAAHTLEGKTPDEGAIREAIRGFVDAALQGDRDAAAKFVHERYPLQQLGDMREAVSAGVKPAEIRLVTVGQGRALAVSEFARMEDPKYPNGVCVVYTLVKQGNGWVIRDIDLEDVEGLAEEIRRFDASLRVTLPFGPVWGAYLREPRKRVAELLDLDTNRMATITAFGKNDRQTHQRIREQKVDVMGMVEDGLAGVLLFDAAVYENSRIDWDKITPEEVLTHRGLNQTEPNPMTPLATEDPSKLPLICLFETREGAMGVLQLLGTSDDGKGVTICYKTVARPAAAAAVEVQLGRLELRVAPTRGGDAKITLPEGEIQRYVKQLEAEGPEPGRKRGDPFAWFPLRSEPSSGLITAKYRDYPFVLLSNRPGEIMLSRSGDPAEWGLKDVSAVEDNRGLPAIGMEFDDDGARRLEKLTEAHLHSPLAVLVDDQVMAAPTIQSKIGRRTLIAGRFTLREVNDLVDVLRASMVPPRKPLTIQCPLDGTVAPLGKLALTRRQHDAVKQWLKTQTPPLSPARFGQFLNTILDDRQRAILKAITASFEQPAEPPTDTPSAKKIHLPDADTPGAEVVLDLASGQMLEVPTDGDHTAFAPLGKGDLFYDRVLACLRGAKAMHWDGEGFVPLPPKDQRGDARAYELPAVPCRLLITTAEKRHFDVRVLAATEDEAVDLQYRVADASVLPKPGQVTPKKVYLPEADGKGEPAVLDLASGETLPFSMEAARDPSVFTRTGKGDLLYEGTLHCLRGAKAVCLGDRQFAAVRSGKEHEDITSYALPTLPCRLRITTAEKKQFDVTVLSATDKGMYLEYRPAETADSADFVIPGTPY